MFTKIKSNFNRKTWVLIAIAILVDWLFSLIVATTNLPIVSFIGLFLVSALCGPWAGALTGFLGTLITSTFWYFLFPDTRDYTLNSFFGWCLFYLFIGYFSGKMAQWGYFKFWWTSILAGFITAISTVTLLLLSDLAGVKTSDFSSIFSFTYFILPMTISAFVVFFLFRSPLNYLIVGLPQTDYVQLENNISDTQLNRNEVSMQKSSPTTAQKAIGLTILVSVIFAVIFVIWIATEMSAAVN